MPSFKGQCTDIDSHCGKVLELFCCCCLFLYNKTGTVRGALVLLIQLIHVLRAQERPADTINKSQHLPY